MNNNTRWIVNSQDGDIWHCMGPGGQIGQFVGIQYADRAVECHNAMLGMEPSDLLALRAVVDAAARTMRKDLMFDEQAEAFIKLKASLDALPAHLKEQADGH